MTQALWSRLYLLPPATAIHAFVALAGLVPPAALPAGMLGRLLTLVAAPPRTTTFTAANELPGTSSTPFQTNTTTTAAAVSAGSKPHHRGVEPGSLAAVQPSALVAFIVALDRAVTANGAGGEALRRFL
jgi:hypothetical protein